MKVLGSKWNRKQGRKMNKAMVTAKLWLQLSFPSLCTTSIPRTLLHVKSRDFYPCCEPGIGYDIWRWEKGLIFHLKWVLLTRKESVSSEICRSFRPPPYMLRFAHNCLHIITSHPSTDSFSISILTFPQVVLLGPWKLNDILYAIS